VPIIRRNKLPPKRVEKRNKHMLRKIVQQVCFICKVIQGRTVNKRLKRYFNIQFNDEVLLRLNFNKEKR